MITVKLNKDSVPGLYSDGRAKVIVLPSTKHNGYVILKGTALSRIAHVGSINGEYSFVKTFNQTKLEIV